MNNETIERPEIVEDEHLLYLDDLRDSGETNMFGAGEYVSARFGFNEIDSRKVLRYWMDTFGKEDR